MDEPECLFKFLVYSAGIILECKQCPCHGDCELEEGRE